MMYLVGPAGGVKVVGWTGGWQHGAVTLATTLEEPAGGMGGWHPGQGVDYCLVSEHYTHVTPHQDVHRPHVPFSILFTCSE